MGSCPASAPAEPEPGEILSADMLARLARLTPRQKDCLRLVRPRYSSKMIAIDLAVSPLRVDAHVGDAMMTLGVNSRFEAGRLLRQWEQTEGAATLGVQLGVQPETLPFAGDLRSAPATVDEAVEMQTVPDPVAPAKAGEGSESSDADTELTTPDRLLRSARHVRVAPSFFTVVASIIAIAVAIGAVTALLITFDWGDHG